MTTDERGAHGHDHDHDHDHDHPGTTPDVNETGYYELMAEAMKELLIEKGVVSADDVRRNLEFLDSRDPAEGAKIIARAWTDPEFKKRLLEDGTELPGDKTVRVHDSNADMRYLVLPEQPAGTEGWSEEQLAAIVTRDAMVGVTLPQA